jgi:hypothetical protein
VNPQPFEAVNYNAWDGRAPLPFEDHASTAYNQQSVLQPQQVHITEPPPGVLVQNIHRMRQQRGGYRMVR